MNDETTIEEIIAINAAKAVAHFGAAQFTVVSWRSVTTRSRWVSADARLPGEQDVYAAYGSQAFYVPDHIKLPLPEIEAIFRAEIERLQATLAP